ncbi:dihydrodipicolinate synthase family protein [Paenibacillus alba]|uniref:dihydrodipicolinate synthase family protein n=1 Tax=Paenibacillus alba TaxID=1197127 RepID=UPI001565A572|nr:dihydrodipicolinate synthase family protein [Paenibacillus alba]NQX68278.1 dihydrodipicolinate synthase family protein [Paenibacillus alba]
MNNFHIALPTPFREDESLYLDGFEPIVNYLKENGIDSMFVSGSTGEQHSMSIEERLHIIDYFNQKRFLDVELIFGVASTTTRDGVRLIQALEGSVFDIVMIGFPPYIKPTQQQAVSYVDELLRHTTKKVILYNNPSRTGFDLSLEALHDLIKRHKNILGLKEAGDVHRHRGTVFPESFVRFAAGDGNLVSNMVSGGCNGLSSMVGNVFPKEIKTTFDALLEGRAVDVEAIDQRIAQVTQGQTIVNIKQHYNQLGMGTGCCRSPVGAAE